VAAAVIASIVAINAAGLCVTYGRSSRLTSTAR
jgi:hypothetical protein